jgi:RNA polymerase sigma-70 factor (ECF subfamily)
MKINLRDFYPFYSSDYFIDVSEEIVHLFNMLARKEHAEHERRRRHKAFYSLDLSSGIESNIVFVVLSPEEIYERKLDVQLLYSAISSLSEKQAKRIYAHFFLRMSKAVIARAEGVNEKSVWESIERGLKNISKLLNEFS